MSSGRKVVKAGTAEVIEPDTGSLGQAFRKIANLLALNLVRGESETEKVLTLTAVGFSIAEIATLLGTKPNTVSVRLYAAKKEAGKRPKPS